MVISCGVDVFSVYHCARLSPRLVALSGYVSQIDLGVATDRIYERASVRMDRGRLSSWISRSQPAYRSHGAAPRIDGGSGATDSARSSSSPVVALPSAMATSKRCEYCPASVGAMAWTPPYESGVLFICSIADIDRMAYPRSVRAHNAITGLAPGAAGIVLCNGDSAVVAGDPTLAERCAMASVDDPFVPVLRHVALRCSLGVSHILRSRHLSVVPKPSVALRDVGSI